MDEKLTDKVCHIHCENADSCTGREDCAIPQAIEQAFRGDGWIEPQQPAEGKLVSHEQRKAVWKETEKRLGFPNAISWSEPEDEEHAIDYCKAQLALDKVTMVKLPSKDELAEMLNKATKNVLGRNWADRGFDAVAQELLKLLQEQKP